MAIFLDTGFFHGLIDPRDARYHRCLEFFKAIVDGSYGQPCTSIHVMGEAAILVARRTRCNPEAIDGIRSLFSPRDGIARLLLTDEDDEEAAWELFVKLNAGRHDKPVSFVDYTSIHLIKKHGIERMLSFDSHFDGIVPRVW